MNVKLVITSALMAAALLPASASAGTATFTNGAFSYTAAPGESNYLIADVSDSCEALGSSPCFSLSDSANFTVVPPPGCVNQTFSAWWILCPIPQSVRIDAGDMLDTILDWNGPSTIDAGPGDDSVFGHGGNDAITGGEGADDLLGGAGDDSVDGGPGADLMEAPISGYGIHETPGPDDSAGADTLVGGSGVDTVSYVLRTDALKVTMDGQANDGAPGERDRISNDVETVIGGQGNDLMIGSLRADALYGYAGDDNLRGGRGDDTLDGGPGQDVVAGDQGADTVSGGHGQDVVDGGQGRDNIYGEYAVGCSFSEACIGGADVLRAQDGERDLISCGVGTDRALIDRVDIVRDIPGATECESMFVPRAKRGLRR
ncbi:MAG TPA: calcium-binding protein [Thermoleophilaceae bacterium]